LATALTVFAAGAGIASAKRPCQKTKRGCPLVGTVTVSQVTASTATITAVINTRAGAATNYTASIEKTSCKQKRCKHPKPEIVATGTVSGGVGEETVTVELTGLTPHGRYEVTVEGSNSSLKEKAKSTSFETLEAPPA